MACFFSGCENPVVYTVELFATHHLSHNATKDADNQKKPPPVPIRSMEACAEHYIVAFKIGLTTEEALCIHSVGRVG